MGLEHSFHAGQGSLAFLGLRKSRQGAMEIVYDGGARRMIWRVLADPGSEGRLADALRLAVDAPQVLPRLYNELQKRAFQIERV